MNVISNAESSVLMKGATQLEKELFQMEGKWARTTGHVKWKEKVVRCLAAVCPQDLESSECVFPEAASISMFGKFQ